MAVSAARAVPIIFLIFRVGATNLKSSTQALEVVTPVEKVKELLGKLQDQVTEEGKNEATQYDKYACFCKEQADNKLYAIENSRDKIEKLKNQIGDLTAQITVLDGDVVALSKKINTLKDDINTTKIARAADHDDYLVAEKNVSQAIDAVDRAIAAMKESKGDLKGNAELNNALVQIAKVSMTAAGTLNSAIHAPENNEEVAYSYKYHSNDIIATLRSLRKSFIQNKDDLDKEEFEAKKVFDNKLVNMQNEKRFAEQEKTEKEALSAAKTEEKQELVEDKLQEEKDKAADDKFLSVLTRDCQSKAEFFDKRSKARAAEITALEEAKEAIGKADYRANKKLNDPTEPVDPKLGGYIQKHSQGHWEWVTGSRSPTFLQRRSYHGQSAVHVTQAVVELLERVASETKSAALETAALKVKLSKDHFVKVRQLIQDLIDRLEEDKRNEQTSKSICDKNMGDATTDRDDAMKDIESTEASIELKNNKISTLTGEVSDLSAAIAANKKAVLEATELRDTEKKDNLKTISTSKAGKESIQLALQILKDFYSDPNPALVQKWVAPDSDREGNTVGDLAPEVFKDEDYKGAQSESKGIIGLLEVILSDFDRTEDTTKTAEQEAEKDFNTFKSDKNADTLVKEGEKDTKEGTIKGLKADIVGLKDDLKAAKNKHTNAEETLANLAKDCVEGVETYGERVAKREKEIAGLREAQRILEQWQG